MSYIFLNLHLLLFVVVRPYHHSSKPEGDDLTVDNYYLLAFEGGKFKHFRVDKMEDVQELTTQLGIVIDREGKDEFENVDMSAYSKYTFSMFGSEITPVTMVFQNRMMGAVMDRFCRDVWS